MWKILPVNELGTYCLKILCHSPFELEVKENCNSVVCCKLLVMVRIVSQDGQMMDNSHLNAIL